MWMADIVLLKNTDHNIYKDEVDSAIRWRLAYIDLKKDQYVDKKLINSLILINK